MKLLVSRRITATAPDNKIIERRSPPTNRIDYVLALFLFSFWIIWITDLDASSTPNSSVPGITLTHVSVAIDLVVPVHFFRDGVKGVAHAIARVLDTRRTIQTFQGTRFAVF